VLGAATGAVVATITVTTCFSPEEEAQLTINSGTVKSIQPEFFYAGWRATQSCPVAGRMQTNSYVVDNDPQLCVAPSRFYRLLAT